MTHPLWPLFDLRIRARDAERGRAIELRLPTQDELIELTAVAKSGIHPPEEMPFGFGCLELFGVPSGQHDTGTE